jgi:hypothetical protein
MSQVTQPNFLDCHITANNVLLDAWKDLPSVFVDDREPGEELLTSNNMSMSRSRSAIQK